MATLIQSSRILLIRNVLLTSQRGRKMFRLPVDFSHIQLPPVEERELVPMSPVPSWRGLEPRKSPRRNADLRGPELVNNDLIYGQFGIITVTAANFTIEHINGIRNVINKHLDINRMFAVWRIEPPWKPISKKSQGKKMGGGKANIHHYVTPVRASTVVVELGGHIELDDCFYFLNAVAQRLPCDAFVISKEILEQWKKEEEEIENTNINPITYERMVERNMCNCHRYLSPYDIRWAGKYI